MLKYCGEGAAFTVQCDVSASRCIQKRERVRVDVERDGVPFLWCLKASLHQAHPPRPRDRCVNRHRENRETNTEKLTA